VRVSDLLRTLRVISAEVSYTQAVMEASKTRMSFLKKCKAQYTVISTASGKYDNVPHSTALKRYKNLTSGTVYRTDVSGTVTWTF
jgi:beta-lactamase superfamily II metal-dependent hydrolase